MSSTAATTPAPKESDRKIAQEALAYLRRAIEKMKALQATERVLASVERAVLNQVPERFDVKPLVAAINELNLAIRDGKAAKISETQTDVSRELDATLQHLISRDDRIKPFHLRRFCEQSDTLLDLNSFAALTSFYRALPRTEVNRGKYDLVVTRLFTAPIPGRSARHRHLRISRDQIAKRLTEMCAAWGEVLPNDAEESAKLTTINAQFDEIIAEAKQISSLEEIVGKNYFQRVRDFKASIGDQIYAPEVAAASVESNVIITNRFLILVELEGNEIREEPEEIQLLTDIFSDTYSNQNSEMAQLLTELQNSSQKYDLPTQERISLFTRLLQLAVKSEAELPLPEPSLPDMFFVEIETPPDPLPAPALTTMPDAELPPDTALSLSTELQALAAEPGNQPFVEEYLQSSAEVQKLDLQYFLSPLPEAHTESYKGEQGVRRKALAIILQADRVARLELAKDCEPGENIEERIERIFGEIEQLSDETRDLVKATRKLEQDNNYEVFLFAYNQLMGARLRLQSAIVRRTANELVEPEAEAKPSQADREIRKAIREQAQDVVVPDSKKAQAFELPVNKWLLVTCAILIVAAVIFRFTYTSNEEQVKDDPNVVTLNRNDLPEAELIQEAKLQNEMMICVVTSKWVSLPPNEQKEKAKILYEYGQQKGAKTIMLFDAQGNSAGVLTAAIMKTE